MDLLSGILLKLGGAHAATLAQLTFWVCGLVLVPTLHDLARAAGLSAPVSFVVSFAFSLLPQTLYFEHLYLYEEPVAALLCLSVALFHGASSRRQSWQLWLAFFSGLRHYRRDPQHVSPHVVRRDDRRRTVVHPGALINVGSSGAASAPATVLLALYVKNLIVFGTFSAFTYGPSSYAHVTVSNLAPEVRAEWAREHKLSAFAMLSPYAGPREVLARVLG